MTWILDTRAIDHIICNLEYFDEYKLVNGLVVNIPNGKTTSVAYIGNIKLSSDIVLQNVLYIHLKICAIL